MDVEVNTFLPPPPPLSDKSVQELIDRVYSISPRYKVYGFQQHNCQDVARAVFNWA